MNDLSNEVITITSTQDKGVSDAGKMRPLVVHVVDQPKGLDYIIWKTKKDPTDETKQINSKAYQFILDNQGGEGTTVDIGYETKTEEYEYVSTHDGQKRTGKKETRTIKAIRISEQPSEAEAPQPDNSEIKDSEIVGENSLG